MFPQEQFSTNSLWEVLCKHPTAPLLSGGRGSELGVLHGSQSFLAGLSLDTQAPWPPITT